MFAYRLILLIKRITVIESSSSSVPFTPYRTKGIHEGLPSIAISIYPLDLIP